LIRAGYRRRRHRQVVGLVLPAASESQHCGHGSGKTKAVMTRVHALIAKARDTPRCHVAAECSVPHVAKHSGGLMPVGS